ncbi:PAS fold family [Synechococcus sp. PCC 7335]|uniref:PAS domain S-box protein n=1 Tax=Synechococcus sp. (strain ATCC 29403 / PCC 7335) TaxID=91464 RepID=UPI00017EB539|nr:PAS domain S-box protein [Synechococcus sp. PCC 7335]EDX83215.1 PAS fold family [Synechococcus sp. PCC 7335]
MIGSSPRQVEHQLQQQLEREGLITKITDAIHQTLDLDQILHTAVDQVRNFLQTDRVIVFRFNSNWKGVVEAESVSPEWPAILGMNIRDSCFNSEYVGTYRKGRISTISDIHTATVDSCYVELLRNVQVRSNLVVPIVQEEYLWGLLIAHHCAGPRQWQPESTQLLKQVATQMGIAIQQAELYQTTRRELIERRRIQAALQASEVRFRSLSAFAPVGIFQTDLDGRCIYTNAKWQEIAGMSLEESLGDSWAQAIHPDDRENVFAAWNRSIAEESDFSMEFRFLKKSTKEVRWVFSRATAMRSQGVFDKDSLIGKIIGYVGVNEDITERKRAEQKIREQAALIDIATDAIFVRDLAGRITFWSKGATKLYGWQPEEALGKNASQLLKKRDKVTVEEALVTTLKQGFWQGEFTQSTKANKNILVASRWTLERDDANNPKFILEVNTDITEKKQLEAHYYQTQKLESLGQLARGVAHDLSNILTPILGIAQLLRLTLNDVDTSTQEQLDILEQSAKRGAKMVRQILTFAKGDLDPQTTADVIVLLQEVINVAQQGFPDSIEIRFDIPTEEDIDRLHREVAIDSTRLHQVFMNLCVNARDAMVEGGVLTVSIDTIDVNEASINKDEVITGKDIEMLAGHYIVVTVADTGVGIAPEVRDRIFDPFFTTKSPDKGTGLGLATVLGIVRKAGGFLKVSSELGQGTEIKVYLPTVEK